MLNFTLINDLSSNKAYIPFCICFSSLSIFSSRNNGTLLCTDVLWQVFLIHCPAAEVGAAPEQCQRVTSQYESAKQRDCLP